MSGERRTSQAGGSLLALSILAGTFIGAVYRQSSIGFLIGLFVGLALLLLVYLRNRR